MIAEVSRGGVGLVGSMVVVFVVQLIGEVGGLGNIAEGALPQDVAIELGADAVFAVIGAGNRDRGQKIVVLDRRRRILYVIGDVQRVVKIGADGNIVHEREFRVFTITVDLSGVRAVGKIFDVGVFDPRGKNLDIIGVGQNKQSAFIVFLGI